MGDESDEWGRLDQALTSNLLSKVAASVECTICSEYMCAPVTCECGHSFCYDCVNSWFGNKLNCPSCRQGIENKPILNLHLKDIGRNIVELLVETTIDENDKNRLIKHRDRSIKIYEDDKRNNQLFGDLFDTATTLIDTSDGVPRCGNCHWEARGDMCNHCGQRLRSNIEDNDSDAYDEDDDELAITLDAPNEYDTEDSFIDGRNDREIFGEHNSFSGGSDGSDQLSVDWAGFGDDIHEVEEHAFDESLPGSFDSSYCDEVDLNQALDRFHQEDRRRHEVIDLSEDEDEDVDIAPSSHSRRVINVSDDEEDW